MAKDLNGPALYRLMTEALVSFIGNAERFEAVLHPGCAMVLCNEPVADLNNISVGGGTGVEERFREACTTCLSRGLPFLVIVFPEAGGEIEEIAADLGLVYAVDFPIMVRDDAPIEPTGNENVIVRRSFGDEGAKATARVLSSAFNMPEDAVRRAIPPSLVESPGIDVFNASLDGEDVGTVTVTHHGETSGIWAMGTNTDRQRSGIGRRLLSTAMAETRERGPRRFFLGATPAGRRLYESLGYTTRLVTRAWVRGETHQA